MGLELAAVFADRLYPQTEIAGTCSDPWFILSAELKLKPGRIAIGDVPRDCESDSEARAVDRGELDLFA